MTGDRVDPGILEAWIDRLKDRDPSLYKELRRRLDDARQHNELVTEATGDEVAPSDYIVETIVQTGRPALLVMDGKITRENTLVDSLAETMVTRLMEAAPRLNVLLPLIGRIDVPNHASGLSYLGTGWLIDRGVVVTNRHVAELIAQWNGAEFVFRPGRFGETLQVSLDNRREHGRSFDATDAVAVKRVIWIEQDRTGPDIAFLEVADRADGTTQTHVVLSETDAIPDQHVAVIGYPARAPVHIIPDQKWMDEIYGGIYDVKRAAPGQMDAPSRGWATHDCTTLGGASGSPVLDMATGEAVALHFAGLYMVENYAVPASTIHKYRNRRPPWIGQAPRDEHKPSAATPATGPALAPVAVRTADTTSRGVSITLPLTISVTIGEPAAGATVGATVAALSLDDAAAALRREARPGILAVKTGHIFAGAAQARACIVAAARPDRLHALRAELPAQYHGHELDVRAATIDEQLGIAEDVVSEAPMAIAYDDDARHGPEFSFEPVTDETSTVLCHVGPESSWEVLKAFLGETKTELVSSIYEFHAAHIADAIESEISEGAEMVLVIDPVSRDSGHSTGPGDFDRSTTFQRWSDRFKFDRVFVPKGNGGLVATSYHIKVTVRDHDTFWLSSGNWKRSSQPLLGPDVNDRRAVGGAGNREWHVVLENRTLSERFRSHILQDLSRSRALGGTLERAEAEVMIDVPFELEALELEAPPAALLEPFSVSGKIKVQPLLTPDRKGRVFTDAVIDLIASARRQLVFQNQYIKISRSTRGNLSDLVDALIERARSIDDVRIILRSGDADFLDAMSELKRRGLDVERCVRRMPATHTKGIVVDGERVLIGSHNWSGSGVSLNRDASLIFDHARIAGYFLKAFEIDWDRARPIDGRDLERPVRVAEEGTAPPPGYRRMTLSEYLEG